MVRTHLSSHRKNVQFATNALIALAVVACSHHPIIPDAKNVEISRQAPKDSECKSLGKVQGFVITSTGTIEQAIEDMKLDASRKGANYIQMESTGAMGTSVSGEAFFCP